MPSTCLSAKRTGERILHSVPVKKTKNNNNVKCLFDFDAVSDMDLLVYALLDTYCAMAVSYKRI